MSTVRFITTILIVFTGSWIAVMQLGPGETTNHPRSLRLRRSVGFENVLNRPKREGFGPFEAQDVWDETGKSNIKVTLVELTKVFINETAQLEAFLNKTEQAIIHIYDVISHPVTSLLKTKTGKAILIICVGSISLVFGAIMARLFHPFLLVVLQPSWHLVKFMFRLIQKSTCCMACCALKPFVCLRNRWIRSQHEAQDRKKVIYDELGREEIRLIERVYSPLLYDDSGPYLALGDNKRVYFQNSGEAVEMFSLSSNKRDKVTTEKEAVLSVSKLYKTEKLPGFQGQFQVDEVVIGHFSRIKFHGKDCMLTAFHVLDYNKQALVWLVNGANKVRFDTIRTSIVSASTTDELDFLIIEVPSYIFSGLGLKVGNWTNRVQAREPIAIHQLYEGKPCVSSASIRLNDDKAWHVCYTASTTVGTSGAPILDSRGSIIGVHLESDLINKVNVGIIPPVFRTGKKESPTNESMMDAEADLKNYREYKKFIDPDSDDDYDDDEELLGKYEQARVYLNTNRDILIENRTTWADEIDNFEKALERGWDLDEPSIYAMYSTPLYRGKHINKTIKGGRLRKESPWTCSKCYCLHVKAGYTCEKCGFALTKLDTDKMRQKQVELAEKRRVLEEVLPVEIAAKIISPIIEEDRIVSKIMHQLTLLLAGQQHSKSFDFVKEGKEFREIEKVVLQHELNPVANSLFPDLNKILDRDPQTTTVLKNVVVPVARKAFEQLRSQPNRDFQPNQTRTLGVASGLNPIVKIKDNNLGFMSNQFNEERSEREGAICLDKVFVPLVKVKKNKQKETLDITSEEMESLMNEERLRCIKKDIERLTIELHEAEPPVSKSAARRARNAAVKAENMEKIKSAVPLNLISPAEAGAPITSGLQKPPISPRNPRLLVGVTANFLEKDVAKKANVGRQCANYDQSTTHISGRLAAPKLKKSVLNTSVTTTLENTKLPAERRF